MSVHGEFSRALENLLAAVDMLAPDQAAPHRRALTAARLSAQPDLSSAARAALEAVARLEGVEVRGERLPDLAAHLEAHCRVILGESDPA